MPAIGELRIGDATTQRLDNVISTIRRTVSASTAKSARSIMSGVMGLAVRYGAIATNPVRDIEAIEHEAKKSPRALTADEVRLVRKQLFSDERAARADLPDLVTFMLGTGVRIGESLAVLWHQVNLDKSEVEITDTIIRVKGEDLISKATKSDAGQRVLPLLDSYPLRLMGTVGEETGHGWGDVGVLAGACDVGLQAGAAECPMASAVRVATCNLLQIDGQMCARRATVDHQIRSPSATAWSQIREAIVHRPTVTMPAALAAIAAVLISTALTAPQVALAVPPDLTGAQATDSIPKNITPVDQIAAEEAGAQIAEVAADYSDAFGGTEWDAKSKTLYVNLATPRGKHDQRAAFQQAVGNKMRTTKAQIKTVFRSVPLSVRGREALLDSFMDSRATWGGPSAVRNVVGAVVDEKTGHLTAQVLADLKGLQQAARRRFGDAVSLRPGQGIELQGRYNDTAPWTSGNALFDEQFETRDEADCTQGFNWRRWSDNLGYASTAGHCWAAGVSLFNGSTTQRIGYVGTRYLNDGEHVDFEYIRITSGSVDNSVWVGGKSGGELRSVFTADNDGTQTGAQVCSSGANGGLACGAIVHRGAYVTYTGYPGNPTISGLTCVKLNSAIDHPVGGDSGAPVLSTASDGRVKAWGQHVGRWDCNNDGVANDMIFTSVKNISARVGASIIIS